ncbi:MAG: LytTR family DNA-binding domain-containing protein [Bacteroidota bacterium]
MKAVLIDDEKHCIITLTKMLEWHCPNVEVVATFTNPELALEELPSLKLDILFLDIAMPEMSGFDFLDKSPHDQFQTIFTTAYDEYAIEAFKVHAIAYLLKPIDEEDLKQAITYAEKNQSKEQSDQIQKLLEKFSNKSTFQKIAIPTSEGLEFIKLNEIIRCQADSNYSIIYLTSGKKKVVSKNLKVLEGMLDESIFFRSHHSHIVNINFISKYLKGKDGQLILEDRSVIPVSRNRKEQFNSLL